MKTISKACTLLTILVLTMMFAGCGGSIQARKVDPSVSPLVNPSIFQEGTGDQALYRYAKPDVDWKQYSKVMIDPVMIAKDGELDEKELKNYQTLANNAYVYLTQALEKQFQIVQAPEPGTMRIQVAIIDADNSKPVRNVLSTVMPIGIGLSIVKYAATGKPSAVGEITGEIKITDATSGDLLAAALDRRVGGKSFKGLWDTWYNADSALKYWAQRTAYVLCTERGGTNCPQPE
ncbi:MAG TPA: DUF3313 domain-containing protein [Geobacteraceae bacterium]|nr:DUF3313 domain-containing protein [Geobacteraceae bacterium]